MRRILVSGIGTGIGKTIAAAVLVQKLGADYWKPVQAGNLDETDTDTVRALVVNPICQFHPESFRLEQARSPHAAAAAQGIEIRAVGVRPPSVDRPLVIEGAGGALVPLNERELLIDALAPFVTEVVVVSRNYLGSINHTLLTLEAYARRKLRVSGLIFNGPREPATESFLLRYSDLPLIGVLEEETRFTSAVIERYAGVWDFS